MRTTVLAIIFLNLAWVSQAEDLGYRYDNGRCVNAEGEEGLNPNYFGQCADFSDRVLGRFDLSDLDFSGSDFSASVLHSCDLEGANFTGADFSYANLLGSTIISAKFDDADLSHVRLGPASAYQASFMNTTLTNSILDGIDCYGCNFTRANLSRANFKTANLEAAIFSEVTAHEVNLREASLVGANLTSANFQISDMAGANLSQVTYEGATFTGTRVNRQTRLPFSQEEAETMGFLYFSCDMDHWVYVDANPEVGQNEEFCVMKYEAKNVDGVATSVPEGLPWVNINRNEARAACEALGEEYTLITNAQWQAMAREIESVPTNWSGDPSNPSTSLNRGHSNGNDALAASGEENAPWGVNKRDHRLKNDEVIWDLAGNVWEWVYDDNNASQGSDGYISQNPANDKSKWGPKADYSNKTNGEYGGLGYGYLFIQGGAVLRGGGWDSGSTAGVFNAYLGSGPAVSYSGVGFRCALRL